ncbi:MAG TPA: endonuclease domain-containing protein [Paucimonas sp.]|nr:endonuclease domain-containing protein [Paucimonas sp.]
MEIHSPHHPARLPDDIRTWAREMRSGMSDAEALLWKLLRNRRLAGAKFRRQHPIGRYILDFYCAERKLCIELDGGQHGEAVAYDQRRDQWLRGQGIQILRFWNNQMLMETEGVLEMIYQALLAGAPAGARTTRLRRTPSSPALLPLAGEGSEMKNK